MQAVGTCQWTASTGKMASSERIYHMRKFSGRPLQQIKKSALTIFTNAKALIKKHKQEEISDANIDEVCDEVIKLLTASYKFLERYLKMTLLMIKSTRLA